MASEAEYEKTSYGTFERFLGLFLIPIIFLTILILVMLSIFGINIKDSVLTAGNKIPYLERIIPEPSSVPSADENTELEATVDREETLKLIQELEEELLNEMNQNQQKESQIAELQQMLDDIQAELNNNLQSNEEYSLRIQQLANVYAKMMPNRAAAIIENLTLSERVLVLNEMITADQIKILEKMNPAAAAEASILLKDQFIAKDIQISALQERLALHHDESVVLLSNEELALTFASMTPANAALVILEMVKINEDKVIDIMRAMNVQARSQLLNAITAISEIEAANLSAKLG